MNTLTASLFHYELKERTHVLIRRLFFGSRVRSTTFRFDDSNVVSWEEDV